MNYLENNRNLGFAKFTIIFAMIFMSVLTLVALINHDLEILIYDVSVISILILSIIIFHKKRIYTLARITLVLLSISSVGLMYLENGEHGVIFWVFLLIQFYMILFGYKLGGIFAGIFSLFYFAFYCFIAENYSIRFLTRYIVAITGVYIVSIYYERFIVKTERKLQELTITDSLTKLYNRRYFDEMFPRQIKIAKRNNQLLVFAMLDIDFFKRYNDSEGHQAGDLVLKKISQLFLDTFIRSNDYVFRLGGEEFGVFYYAEDRGSAIAFIENFRHKVENLKIEHRENDISPYVTISVGLYIIENDNQKDCDEIYKICDDALYDAKKFGRNRVEISKK